MGRDSFPSGFQVGGFQEHGGDVELVAVQRGLVGGTLQRVQVFPPNDRRPLREPTLLDVETMLVGAMSATRDRDVTQAAVTSLVFNDEVRVAERVVLEVLRYPASRTAFGVVEDDPLDRAERAVTV